MESKYGLRNLNFVLLVQSVLFLLEHSFSVS